MVKHTTRYLGRLVARFGFDQENLHQFAIKHLSEENRHEIMALNDLKYLGGAIEDYPPMDVTQYMIQSQYYWLEHLPAAHFGFFFVLETLSITKFKNKMPLLREIYPNRALTFLAHHTEEDVQHVDNIEKKVNTLSQKEVELISENIRQTGNLYSQMFADIKRVVSERSDLKKVA